ncbi:MAG: ABC transporter substrate-binding protein [Elainellaceae cyanobacterium]
MSQKNELPVLVTSLLITLVLIGGGVWWIVSQTNLGRLLSSGQSSSESVSSDTGNLESSSTGIPSDQVLERISTGQTILVAEPASTEKQAGVEAIAQSDYRSAIAQFEAALRQHSNDPETLIYLNNARIGTEPSHTIAVAVPAATAVNPANEILRGVAQAQHEINQSNGIDGVPLRVAIASDDNDPAVATQIAQALAQNQEVLGVVGHFGSETTLAASEVYEREQLVVISPTSTSTRLSDAGNYLFRTVPSDRFTATTLSRYLVNTLQQQNAAIYFNAESDYSQSLKNEFTTALYSDGGQIVAEFDLADSSFSALDTVEYAIQQNAQVLVLAANTSTLDQALQVITVNRRQLNLLGGDSLYNPKTLQVGGAAAEGMVVAAPWVLLSNPQSEFVQTSRQLWGGDINWRTAMAYDATLALINGLNNPTRQQLQQTLSSPDFSFSGATGSVEFLPSGDRNQAMQLVIVETGNRSSFGYDFIPVE